MKEQLLERLKELNHEFAKGQGVLKELDEQSRNIRDTLLRISGAIQVLQEELTKENGFTSNQLTETENLDKKNESLEITNGKTKTSRLSEQLTS
ncbi:hypothetical protein NIES2119_21515 [[Phormidium ambiguum] IAM M-71]|uniref:DUF3782 domain-containing protein n=1 Tax=[Phormidium ambiguum] IAM M-71 TaxID=454136 RepID=A0A1U7IBU8_9CYAN|nr:hypothetical protein [Phormidium ambiguum]OKH34082.1 hypothetical protein NIES2119_21515 [Phormidium ambiguum IAM M-71]